MPHSGWFEFFSVSQLRKLQKFNDQLEDPLERARRLKVRWYKPGRIVNDGPWEERPECTRARYEERAK